MGEIDAIDVDEGDLAEAGGGGEDGVDGLIHGEIVEREAEDVGAVGQFAAGFAAVERGEHGAEEDAAVGAERAGADVFGVDVVLGAVGDVGTLAEFPGGEKAGRDGGDDAALFRAEFAGAHFAGGGADPGQVPFGEIDQPGQGVEDGHGGAGAIDERLFHDQCAVATQAGRAADARAAEPKEGGDGCRQH
jgi:hypothetical protein